MTTLQRAAIYEKMSCNQFPQARRISSRCTVWDEREILAWMEALPRGVGRRPGKTPDATSAAA